MVSRALQGVFRSLRLYHGPDAPKAAMDALYRQFVEPGDLVFDIGAHVGDRVSSFRRLGARVIAVEPQPLLVSALRHIHGRDPLVEIVARAAGSRADTLAASRQHGKSNRFDHLGCVSAKARAMRAAGKARPGMLRLPSTS